MLVTTTKFEPVARYAADELNMPDTRIVAVGHPLGGTDATTIVEWADAAVDATIELLT